MRWWILGGSCVMTDVSVMRRAARRDRPGAGRGPRGSPNKKTVKIMNHHRFAPPMIDAITHISHCSQLPPPRSQRAATSRSHSQWRTEHTINPTGSANTHRSTRYHRYRFARFECLVVSWPRPPRRSSAHSHTPTSSTFAPHVLAPPRSAKPRIRFPHSQTQRHPHDLSQPPAPAPAQP